MPCKRSRHICSPNLLGVNASLLVGVFNVPVELAPPIVGKRTKGHHFSLASSSVMPPLRFAGSFFSRGAKYFGEPFRSLDLALCNGVQFAFFAFSHAGVSLALRR